MRKYAASQAESQSDADRCHAHLIATDKHYAESVTAGGTKRWAVPQRDVDDKGQPVGQWWIAVAVSGPSPRTSCWGWMRKG